MPQVEEIRLETEKLSQKIIQEQILRIEKNNAVKYYINTKPETKYNFKHCYKSWLNFSKYN